MSQELFLAFSKYIGVPYVSKGRSPCPGWDCYGLYWWVQREATGRILPDYLGSYVHDGTPGRDTSVAMALRGHTARWQGVPMAEVVPGDAVVFNLAGVPLHVGLVIGGGKMLHCLQGRETVVEQYVTAGWSKRIEGFYRWNS